jgi:hypothetical protein
VKKKNNNSLWVSIANITGIERSTAAKDVINETLEGRDLLDDDKKTGRRYPTSLSNAINE